MHYRVLLILFMIFVFMTGTLCAQDTRYRVEVLVLTHLKHSEEALETQDLPDYSFATDFLTPPEETAEEVAPATDAGILPENEAEAEAEPEPDPNALVHLEEMSDVMREAWRRLRLSAPFRPQQYLSWEQGDQEPFPALRIHDLEIVMSKDPHARERLELIRADLLESESERQARVFADAAGMSRLQNSELAPEPEEPAVPAVTLYYRLDGTVVLRRSRFLHLDLDMQMREGIWEPETLVLVSQDPPIYERAGPTAFKVHELRQSRQVKTERMEYFDGPVLSALAYITAIKAASEDTSQ